MGIGEGTRLEGQIWLLGEAGTRLGGERIRLLEEIAQTGSISQAARNVGLSYKAVWDAVNAMNNLADTPVVERQAGGRHGGGTRVTAHGEELIRVFREMDAEYRRFVTGLGQRINDFASFQQLMRRFAMRTSARNQLKGKVLAIKRGPVNSEVTLALNARERLISIITDDSVEALGLAVGAEVFALIKASFVILTSADDGFNTSARNRLCGEVSEIHRGPVNSEVVIELEGGKSIAAVITDESLRALGLEEGARACALVKASHVILGVE